jgi:hypothetical protein
MRPIEVLDKLYESGELMHLAKSGLLSTSVLIYRKIYHAYEFQLLNGVSKEQAKTDISGVFGMSERQISRVISKLK